MLEWRCQNRQRGVFALGYSDFGDRADSKQTGRYVRHEGPAQNRPKRLGIEVISVDFKRQRGAYKVLMRNRFIFIKNDLDPVTERVVMLHEIGHDVLHRKEAVKAGGFKEFNIFNMRENRMEYEANVFASQVSLDDEEILEYIHYGYDIQRIASAMHTDANLVALKTDALIAQGYCLHHQEYENRFLK